MPSRPGRIPPGAVRFRDHPRKDLRREPELLRMIRHAPCTVDHPNTDEIRAKVLAEFTEYLDTKLAELRPGEGIGYFLTIEVVQRTVRSKAWAEAVKARDGDRCRACGTTENLHAHHVVPVSVDPSLADDLDNGVTLCAEHHAGAHAEVYDQPHLTGVITSGSR